MGDPEPYDLPDHTADTLTVTMLADGIWRERLVWKAPGQVLDRWRLADDDRLPGVVFDVLVQHDAERWWTAGVRLHVDPAMPTPFGRVGSTHDGCPFLPEGCQMLGHRVPVPSPHPDAVTDALRYVARRWYQWQTRTGIV